MRLGNVVCSVAAGLLGANAARADAYRSTGAPFFGSLVQVSMSVEGGPTPLYPAPDGSGRYYVEARRGAAYTLTLTNRTAARLGVLVDVDGLNVISGEREAGTGRMYILSPWETTTVQGWRTSLEDVRRFTFIDEARSYAARTGQFNGKVGWIEVAVFRERRVSIAAPRLQDRNGRAEGEPAPPRSAAAPPTPESKAADGAVAVTPTEPGGSYPGTGWGPRAVDPVQVVRFDPEPQCAERITLRYEYRSALLALGILPGASSDRLAERDRGAGPFARPPQW